MTRSRYRAWLAIACAAFAIAAAECGGAPGMEPPKDAKHTASGLTYVVLRDGAQPVHPTATSTVTVAYTGWTTDGKMFDSSDQHGGPQTFPLNDVIPGWTEGVQLMIVGEKARFWIPESLAYAGAPGAPAGTLVFDIELLRVQ